MKRLAITLLAFLALLSLIGISAVMLGSPLVATPAYAANQTLSGNISARITLTQPVDLVDADVAAITAALGAQADTVADSLGDILVALIAGGIVALAFWRQEFILYILAAITMVIYGFSVFTLSVPISVLIGILGAYSAWKALETFLRRA